MLSTKLRILDYTVDSDPSIWFHDILSKESVPTPVRLPNDWMAAQSMG
jgi:hypothetical protein